MDPAQAQTGRADSIEKLTREIQLQSKHVTKNYWKKASVIKE